MFLSLSMKAMMLILCGFAGLMFDDRYAWATRWSKEGMVVEARVYLDSMLVNTAIDLNEAGLFAYSDLRNR